MILRSCLASLSREYGSTVPTSDQEPIIVAHQDRSMKAGCWSGVGSEDTMSFEEEDPESMAGSSETGFNRSWGFGAPYSYVCTHRRLVGDGRANLTAERHRV